MLIPRECSLGIESPSLQPQQVSFPRPDWLPASGTSWLWSTLGVLCAETALHLRAPEVVQGALSEQPPVSG